MHSSLRSGTRWASLKMTKDRATRCEAPPVLVAFPSWARASFRVEVIDAYSRRCAITGEEKPTLEAGHIRPYAKEGPHEIRNGLP